MIEKRGDGVYRIGFQVRQPDGRYAWVRETFHATPGLTEKKQRKEAEEALALLRLQVKEGKRKPDIPAPTVRSFSELWIEQHVRPNCKPTTLKNYRSFLDTRILPALGDVPLTQLTPMMLTQWLNDVRISPRRTSRKPDDQLTHKRSPADQSRLISDDKKATPLGARTIQHYYDTLAGMLDVAVRWKYLQHNPMEGVTRPKARKPKANFLTEERAVELLRCLADEPNMCYRAALLLALICGLRLGEVGALKLSDVDWVNCTIDISRALGYTSETGSYIGTTKSEAGDRQVDLPAGMMAVLHETRAYQEECARWAKDVWVGEGWIVHGWNGARMHHDTPSHWFREFADAHGFEGVRFHDLRHTHATILLANNVDAVSVASRMGHEDASTTLRVYAHALRRRDRDAANVAQRLFDLAASDDGQGDD